MKHIFLVIILAVLLLGCVPEVKRDEQQQQSAEQQTEQPDAQQAEPEQQDPVQQAMRQSAKLLGVSESSIGTDGDKYRLPVTGDEMELALAASVVQGQLELAGTTVNSSDATDDGWLIKAALEGRKIRVTLGGGIPLAIVIDDFGRISGDELTNFCRRTDRNVTFAIMPDEQFARDAMRQGSAAGHECILHMPMEAMDNSADGSPRTLKVSMSSDEIKALVRDWMKKLPQCVGANNHQGSRFSADTAAMDAALEVMRDEGYYFIDSRTHASTVAYREALRLGVPAAERRVFLDVPDISDANLTAKIAECKKIAAQQGSVVAISHCFPPAKLDYLLRFIDMARDEGFVLVPASKIVGGAPAL